ncbi:MAG: hypothetical protein JWQ81_3691 [Amycolatopsis sp.]|jgi:hypothetical protein|nr:hypothetical protein [Amycolatopsis sp.]
MGRHTLQEDPVPHQPEPREDVESTYTTGTHRAIGKAAPRRGVAKWPIACLVLVGLIVVGVFGWNWASGELNNRAEAAAASCTAGSASITVVVAPAVLKPIQEAADSWDQSNTVVDDHCVHADILAKTSQQMLDALSGQTSVDSVGGLPDAWIPESTYWGSQLQARNPALIGSLPQSLTSTISADYPFLGLSGTSISETQMRAAQSFRAFLQQPAQKATFAKDGITGT